jgi:hypothetical protein
VGNDHELVQGWPAKDGIEWEVDLCNIEDDALHMVVLKHPKCGREGDATIRDDGAQTHSSELARMTKLGSRNLQLLESHQTDAVEGRPTNDHNMVQPNVGDGRGDEQQELSSSRHVLGAVGGVQTNRHPHPLMVGHCPRHRRSRRHRSARSLDDAPGPDVPIATVHEVEHLAMLIGAGVGVGVAICNALIFVKK